VISRRVVLKLGEVMIITSFCFFELKLIRMRIVAEGLELEVCKCCYLGQIVPKVLVLETWELI